MLCNNREYLKDKMWKTCRELSLAEFYGVCTLKLILKKEKTRGNNMFILFG